MGTIAAGTGAVFGSGAFTTVEAERSIAIDVADDSDALIGLAAGSSAYVTDTDGLLAITLDDFTEDGGLNRDASITIRNAFTITNNHDSSVKIDLSHDVGEDISLRFKDDTSTDPSIIEEERVTDGGDLSVKFVLNTSGADATDFSGNVTITADTDTS